MENVISIHDKQAPNDLQDLLSPSAESRPSDESAIDGQNQPTTVLEPKEDLPCSDDVPKADSADVSTEMTQTEGNIFFIDPVGIRWCFPYDLCKTWKVNCPAILHLLNLLTDLPFLGREKID